MRHGFKRLDEQCSGFESLLRRESPDGNMRRMDAKLDRKADATLVARVEALER